MRASDQKTSIRDLRVLQKREHSFIRSLLARLEGLSDNGERMNTSQVLYTVVHSANESNRTTVN